MYLLLLNYQIEENEDQFFFCFLIVKYLKNFKIHITIKLILKTLFFKKFFYFIYINHKSTCFKNYLYFTFLVKLYFPDLYDFLYNFLKKKITLNLLKNFYNSYNHLNVYIQIEFLES